MDQPDSRGLWWGGEEMFHVRLPRRKTRGRWECQRVFPQLPLDVWRAPCVGLAWHRVVWPPQAKAIADWFTLLLELVEYKGTLTEKAARDIGVIIRLLRGEHLEAPKSE